MNRPSYAPGFLTKAGHQYRAVQRSGLTNMLDLNNVQLIAHGNDFHQLVILIEDTLSKDKDFSYEEFKTFAEWAVKHFDYDELEFEVTHEPTTTFEKI